MEHGFVSFFYSILYSTNYLACDVLFECMDDRWTDMKDVCMDE